MQKRRIIWGALLLFTFLLFYCWIPNGTYSQAPWFFAGTGAILFFFFLVQTVSDFKSWEEVNAKTKEAQDWRHKLLPVHMVAGIIMCIVFLMHLSSKETDELKQFGEKTKGTIIDGKGVTNLRGNGSYDVTVQFYTKEGQLLTIKKDVSKEEFNRLSNGQEVDMMYSTKHPGIIKFLNSDVAVEEMTGIKDKPLTIADLTGLMKMKPDSVGSFLNKCSYKWELRDSGWLNERLKQFVKVNNTRGMVTYVSMGEGIDGIIRFPSMLEKDNFHRADTTHSESATHGLRIYENDHFLAMVTTKVREGFLTSSLLLQKK